MDDPGRFLPLPQAMFHILVALAEDDLHGYAIMLDVAARTNGKLKLSPGTLYGSIKKMLEDGLIQEIGPKLGASNDDERRRYYRLTRFGRQVAAAEAERLTALLAQARANGLIPKRS
jgi:DNA-binding PadR family transcriptional regulator